MRWKPALNAVAITFADCMSKRNDLTEDAAYTAGLPDRP
jgi:hypothetical protein